MLSHTRLQARGKVTLPAFLWGQREGNSSVPRWRGEHLPGAPVRHGDEQRLCGGGACPGLVFLSLKGTKYSCTSARISVPKSA